MGEWCTPTPFHSVYHHIHSCSVRSSREGRYAHSISSLVLYPYVLCVHNQDDLHCQPTICMICIIHTLDGVRVPIDPRVVRMVRNQEGRHGLKTMVCIQRLTGRLVFLLLPLLLTESWESRRGNRGRRMDSPVPRRERGLLDAANKKKERNFIYLSIK